MEMTGETKPNVLVCDRRQSASWGANADEVVVDGDDIALLPFDRLVHYRWMIEI